MSWNQKTSVLSACLLALSAGSLNALVHDRSDESPLQERGFLAAELEATPRNARPASLVADAELEALGAIPDVAFLDERGGRWRTLLFSLPMIPGNGVGNELTWEGVQPAGDAALGELAWRQVRDFVAANAASLRIDVDELDHRVAVHDGGELIQIAADRTFRGLPVRGARFGAVLNHGNLVLLGAERWGDIAVGTFPAVPAESALQKVSDHVAPMRIDSLREASTLAIVPAVGSDGRYAHRLVWVVRPVIPGDIGQWEGLVDARTGELVAFQDLNHYGASRTITGGVYPLSYDGIAPDGNMVDGYPMPFADLSSGGFTDAGGNFDAGGSVTTTLSGEYIDITPGCGSLGESSTGDLDLGGADGDIDCDSAGTSAGNTAASRSGFYELNRIAAIGRAQLPANGWLAGTLEAQMNISVFCNAFWTGAVVQFFRESFPCGNTGQLAGVFDHEWGHGMDDNDVDGGIPSLGQGGGEGMADIYAGLRMNQACMGRGFFLNGGTCGGYGDPCTAASGCTGVRSIDWADRASGVPHTLTWVRDNPSCGSVHCTGAAYSETVWDLLKRDLPTLHGMDNNTALEVVTRLTYLGAGNASGWFDRSGPAPGAAACGATQAYLQYLAADDDNGNLADGTPHMDAIASAFDRHEIGCTPANGGPTVTVGGCAGTPTAAPTLSASAVTMGAELSWSSVAGASGYDVFRTDGERACDYGKELVGSTAGTTFSDTGLLDGRPYFWVVIPKGPAAACFGPASNCASIGLEDIFADGFESGDVAVWSSAVP